MLRRAALRLRNAGAVSMEDDVEDALRDLAGELGKTRNDMIGYIVRDWMETNEATQRLKCNIAELS